MSTAVEMQVQDKISNGSPVARTGPMGAGPVFVVGMWRSGTSLLYALLNQHPQIGLMYESDLPLLSSFFTLPHLKSSWIAKIDSWNGALTRHKIDMASLPATVEGLPDAFRAVAQQYAEQKGATIWGCKSPNYYDCMNQLANWFPNAKFIVIWRDPADVCRSIVRAAKKSPWFARPGMDIRALLGCHRMKQEADELVRRGVAIYQLQYDDLVREPAVTLAAICDFIGVEFDPGMTSLEGADRSAIYDAEHHAGVKSAEIVARRDRPEVLSSEFKGKVERYVAYWRRQYSGDWPVNAATGDGVKPAGWAERTRDRIRHSLLRSFDLTVPVLYSLIPVAAWKKYREVKSRYRQNAVTAGEGEAS